MNQLLLRFGLQFTNLYTDVKKLVLPPETPLIGGLRWGYYTGNLVLITPEHPAKPRPLVLNDLAQKPLNGPRDTPGALLALQDRLTPDDLRALDYLYFSDTDFARQLEADRGVFCRALELAAVRLKLAEPKSRLLAMHDGVPFCGCVLGATKRRFEARRRLLRRLAPANAGVESRNSHAILP